MSSQALPAPGIELFRYLFAHASLGIAVEDLEGKILFANPRHGGATENAERNIFHRVVTAARYHDPCSYSFGKMRNPFEPTSVAIRIQGCVPISLREALE